MRDRITDKKIIDRFMSKVVVGNNPDDCWTWIGSFLRSDKSGVRGHGQFRVGKECVAAHCISFRIFIGPISDGRIVCHSCRNRCPNPKHIYLGTHQSNLGPDRERDGTLPTGTRNGKAKLTNEEVKEIRNSSKFYGELATEFRISYNTAWLVKNGRTYKEVT
jgi:hypothetical protein